MYMVNNMIFKNRESQLERLNADYLELINIPEVKKVIYQNDKKLGYKIAKLLEIAKTLGMDTFIKYLNQKRGKIKHNNVIGLEEDTDIIKKNNSKKEKIAVYTAIFGNIDNIIEPFFKPDNIDYYIITDQSVPEESMWKKVENTEKKIPSELTNQYKNRFCKLFPDVFFDSYDYSIYVDGNIMIVSDLTNLVSKLSNKEIGLFAHPSRSDVYLEAAAVIYLNNAKANDVKKQIRYYKNEGFPENFGLFENSLIVRKHNGIKCKKIMQDWWEQLNTYTCRDQLSLMYVLWKNDGINNVRCLGPNIDLYPVIRRVRHINK